MWFTLNKLEIQKTTTWQGSGCEGIHNKIAILNSDLAFGRCPCGKKVGEGNLIIITWLYYFLHQKVNLTFWYPVSIFFSDPFFLYQYIAPAITFISFFHWHHFKLYLFILIVLANKHKVKSFVFVEIWSVS